jgi:D-serine deaminase-like pyridoxal phosphate-dependent protein
MSVLSTVVSTSCPGFSTIDGGSKTFTNDALRRDGSNGHVREYPDIYLERMNEEHGVLSLSQLAEGAPRPRVGEKVHVIPNHACGTTNLHDVVYGYRRRNGEELVEFEWPVHARGKIR